MAKRKRAVRRHQTESLQLAGGQLRIALVADTHSNPHPDSLDLIADRKPDAILHAGDIGSLDVLDALAEIAPTIAVRGNIDTRAPSLPDSVALTVRDGEHSVLKMLLLHIAVYGPKLRADCARLADKEGARIVLCGHSHVPFIGRDKGKTIFNPGSIGPRRFRLPITFGMLSITSSKMDLHHVSCETGERWEPPG
jgi:hypothetical protein